MKILKYIITLAFVFLVASCGSLPIAKNSGKSDMGYLMFISTKKYQNTKVDVVVDKDVTFKAKTVAPSDSYSDYTKYSLSTGRHHILVSYDGSTLLNKNIFVSPSETKQIILP